MMESEEGYLHSVELPDPEICRVDQSWHSGKAQDLELPQKFIALQVVDT